MEHEQELREFTMTCVKELGLTIGEIQVEHFMRYLTHLIEWNKTINLTSIISPEEIVVKHFIDSLASLVSTKFPQNCVVLDIGSGGGFPGIPLKIMRPDMRLTLIEPVKKKCSFLNSVIGLLQLQNVATFNGTIEQYAKNQDRNIIDLIVIRALKYEDFLKYLPRLLSPIGRVVLYGTATMRKQEFGKEFHLLSETALILPQGSGNRVVTVIEKTDS